ncbi:tyrosine-type recombinase/integrase [Mycobacterium bourgelatii]|uniref:Site-specific integrase n=1 Tax=Mycobacterium bourgelatii TaxID=1273442 RepID=A0A7I9YP31_MYCBU|nr:site-specific integrase [Mycobacterium bourgelatii]MCV6975335.1 site-specific integrase [Mycobacterium bourgelatii]GFG90434.1 site-specific integrase [Mycobacterium bourgelatii]
MAKRRSNGEGTLYHQPNGTWSARLSYLDPETGQRKRVAFYAPTQREVKAKMKAARDRIDAGAPPKDATVTVGAWLAHWRQTTLAASSRKEATRELYANLSRVHLEPPPFGATPLDRLKPSDIERIVLDLRGRSKTRGEGDDAEQVRALSDSTIRTTYTVLRSALDAAVRDGLLGRNPAAQVKRPAVQRAEAKHLAPDDVAALLRAATDSRYHPALALIAATGLRRGEALALRWADIDLDAGLLRVTQTLGRVGKRLVVSEPKTQRARRTVPLSPPVVAVLKKHRTAQIEERIRAANKWEETGLVFTTALGTPVDPRNLTRVVEVAAQRAGLEGVGVHTLRHSAATAWLERVHIKAVSDLLGHASVAITGDVYGHTSDDTARAAVEGLTNALGL